VRIPLEYLLLLVLMIALVIVGLVAMPLGMEVLVPGPVVTSPLPGN
jgi:hypothetical protein